MKMNVNTCKGFATASFVCALVSLIVGGALLDMLGVVLGFYGYANAKKLLNGTTYDPYTQRVMRLARNAIIICVIAAVLNVVTALFVVPASVDMAGVSTSAPAF